MRYKIIWRLNGDRKDSQAQSVFFQAGSVHISLDQIPSKNRKGQSADNPQKDHFRVKNKAYVINGHRNDSDDFQRIVSSICGSNVFIFIFHCESRITYKKIK